jgi:hypothetical protein
MGVDLPGDDPWVEHPDHPVADWQAEVANDDTRLGYRDWTASRDNDAQTQVQPLPAERCRPSLDDVTR